MKKYVFLVSLLTVLAALPGISVHAASQWHSVTSINNGQPKKIIQHQDYLYAAELNGHILRTKDIKVGWEPIMIDEVDNSCYLASDGETIYGSKLDGYSYKTKDNFQTITVLPLKNKKVGDSCTPLLVQNNIIIAGSHSHIFFSENYGATFNESTYSFDNKDMDVTGLYQNSLGIIIATTSGYSFNSKRKGILFSKDGGHTWEQSDAPDSYDYDDYAVTTSDNKFYAAPYKEKGQLLVSDNGTNWQPIMSPLPFLPARSVSYTIAVDSQERIYAMTKKGTVISSGDHWKLISTEFPESTGRMTIYNNQLLEMFAGGKVRLYSPETNQWTALPGTTNVGIFSMYTTKGAAYAVSGGPFGYGPLFKKTNTENWSKVFGELYETRVSGLFADEQGAVFAYPDTCLVFFSEDHDKTFKWITAPPLFENDCSSDMMAAFRSNGTIWASFALNSTASAIIGTEDHKNWNYRNDFKGDPAKTFTDSMNGTVFNAAGHNQISRSIDSGISWCSDNKGINKGDSLNYVFYDRENDALYASHGNNFIDTTGGLYRLRKGSDTWENIGLNLPEQGTKVYGVTVLDGYIYASINGYGVYMRKQDSLGEWDTLNSGLPTKKVKGIISFNNALYVGTEDTGLFEYILN